MYQYNINKNTVLPITVAKLDTANQKKSNYKSGNYDSKWIKTEEGSGRKEN